MNDSIFHLAVGFVLRMEGGLVNDPDDPGGLTNFGISKRAHPEVDVEHLTEGQAIEIYRKDYWEAYGCDRLPPMIGFVMLDSVVNHGARLGVRLLQQALGVHDDGINGPVTQAAARSAPWEDLLIELLARRGQLYQVIVTAQPRKARFMRGWMRRIFALQREIYVHRSALA